LDPHAAPRSEPRAWLPPLGASLSEWVGTATRDDFAEATATVAHRTAESLCVPEYLTSLLDGLAGDLRGPAGAVLVEVVRPWLPLERNDATAAEVANFVAESSAAPGNTLSWLFPLLLAAPTPRLVESIGALVGAQGLSMVAAADPVQLVKHAWLARAVTKAVAGASAEPLRRGDGAVIELEPALRELAKRCLEQPLRFHRSTDDVNEGDVLAAVYAATGGHARDRGAQRRYGWAGAEGPRGKSGRRSRRSQRDAEPRARDPGWLNTATSMPR
jgi:hypothetical protein